MKRLAYLVLALANLSCSVFDGETERGGLRKLWSTPATPASDLRRRGGLDGERYYLARNGALHAYRTADGKLAWSRRVANICSPVLVRGGRVFCPSDKLEAFEAATGTLLWSFTPPTSTFQLTEGAIDEAHVYSGTLDGTVYAHDVATGALVWQRTFREASWVGADIRGLTVSGDTLFAGLTRHYSQNAYFSAAIVVAVEAATGRELWRFQDGDGSDSRSVSRRAPTVAGRLVIYANNNAAEYTAFDRQTQQVAWRVKEEPGYVGPYQAPEVVDGIGCTDRDDR